MCIPFLGTGGSRGESVQKMDMGTDFLELRVMWTKVDHKQKHKPSNFHSNVSHRK